MLYVFLCDEKFLVSVSIQTANGMKKAETILHRTPDIDDWVFLGSKPWKRVPDGIISRVRTHSSFEYLANTLFPHEKKPIPDPDEPEKTVPTIQEQVRRVNYYKRNRYRNKRVPNYIAGEIDLSDDREVARWKAIEFHQRHPHLKNVPQAESMTGQTVTDGETFLYGQVVYEIFTILDGEFTIGTVCIQQEGYDDNGVWGTVATEEMAVHLAGNNLWETE
jgi:hypothetical protein